MCYISWSLRSGFSGKRHRVALQHVNARDVELTSKSGLCEFTRVSAACGPWLCVTTCMPDGRARGGRGGGGARAASAGDCRLQSHRSSLGFTWSPPRFPLRCSMMTSETSSDKRSRSPSLHESNVCSSRSQVLKETLLVGESRHFLSGEFVRFSVLPMLRFASFPLKEFERFIVLRSSTIFCIVLLACTYACDIHTH